MTLVEFISSVCREVFEEEGLIQTESKKTVPAYNSTKPIQSTKKIITETILKDMINQGTANQLNDKSRFTPLARDLWREYKNKK